jgi:hypothetical protein
MIRYTIPLLRDQLFFHEQYPNYIAPYPQMAATYDWQSDHGTATGSPPKGTTRSTGRTDMNWKNIDDAGTAYTANPITAGNNSFEIWMFGKFTGTFNQILNGKWAHTATAFGTGLTLKGATSMTADGDNETYTTPSTTTNANLSVDMTSAIAIGSGSVVYYGATGPEATGKATSSTNATTYSNWLVTQLQTTGSAAAGDTAQVTITHQYEEN